MAMFGENDSPDPRRLMASADAATIVGSLSAKSDSDQSFTIIVLDGFGHASFVLQAITTLRLFLRN